MSKEKKRTIQTHDPIDNKLGILLSHLVEQAGGEIRIPISQLPRTANLLIDVQGDELVLLFGKYSEVVRKTNN